MWRAEEIITMQSDEIFNNLVRNAFDFLNHSLTEVEERPKYALISFVSAVEIIFKARLMIIDSMWISSEPAKASLDKLKQGKLRTVDLKLAQERILAFANETIPRQADKAFETVTQHRNRVVHFFHPDLDAENLRKSVISEIFVAWHFLHKLLTETWRLHFLNYSDAISNFAAELLSKKSFLQAIFNKEIGKTTDHKNWGICPACHFASLDAKTDNHYLSAICRVCGYTELSHKAIQDGGAEFTANCADCGSEECVRQTDYGYTCSQCDEVFSTLFSCDYCGTNWVGLDENHEGRCDNCTESDFD